MCCSVRQRRRIFPLRARVNARTILCPSHPLERAVAIRLEIVDALAPIEQLEQLRALMREYAAMPHTVGRWDSSTADIAALPTPFIGPTGLLLMAKRDGAALACGALLALDREYMEIKRVYVRPAARGLGLGARMTTALMRHAKRLGYSMVRLDTAPELHVARSLYERLGFQPIGPYKDGLRIDTLFFERSLQDIDPQDIDPHDNNTHCVDR
jgi:putative acetyltransferase